MSAKKPPSTDPAVPATASSTEDGGSRFNRPGSLTDIELLPKRFDFFAAQMKHELDRIRTVLIPALDRIEALMRDVIERVEQIEAKQHEIDDRVRTLEDKQAKRDTRNRTRRKTAKLTVVK